MTPPKPNIDVASKFISLCKSNPDKSEAVVAIELLTKLIESSDVTAVQGLNDLMLSAIKEMCQNKHSNISVQSACELFQRFITLAALDIGDFEECKRVLLQRAKIFIDKVGACRKQIAENTLSLLWPGVRLLVFARSRCVEETIETAAATFRTTDLSSSDSPAAPVLRCFVLEGGPSRGGEKLWRSLTKIPGVSAQLVCDAAVAYLMSRVDAVLLGAEAVVESGGILNRLGSATVATVASAYGKPVYVLAESFKFLRCFPLDQFHIPSRLTGLEDVQTKTSNRLVQASGKTISDPDTDSLDEGNISASEDEEASDRRLQNRELVAAANNAWERVKFVRNAMEHGSCHQKEVISLPNVDYTMPSHVTALITDLGVLSPSAVSDELIKLYL